MCTTTTHAKPGRSGIRPRSVRSAASAPAEAPMPTTWKSGLADEEALITMARCGDLAGLAPDGAALILILVYGFTVGLEDVCQPNSALTLASPHERHDNAVNLIFRSAVRANTHGERLT